MTFFPSFVVEAYYGVDNSTTIPDHYWSHTDIAGQVVLRLIQAFGACCLGFACLHFLPLIHGGEKETIQLALIVSAISGAMSTLFAITWPEDGSFGGAKETEQAFALQNLFLTGLPLGAYFHVPDCGLSRIYKLKELQDMRWWFACNQP